jgi:hypothetical protein
MAAKKGVELSKTKAVDLEELRLLLLSMPSFSADQIDEMERAHREINRWRKKKLSWRFKM